MTYGLTLIPLAIAAMALEGLVIAAVNAMPRESVPDWVTWPLNTIPAFGLGLVVYQVLGRRLQQRSPGRWHGRAYVHDTWPLYLVAVLGIGYMASQRGNTDFWLFGQLILWPTAVAVGGLVGDAIARPSRSGAARGAV